MDDAYEILLRKKRKDESFSDVIRRIGMGRKDLMQFAGAWKDISEKDIANMKSDIVTLRKKSTLELLNKHHDNN